MAFKMNGWSAFTKKTDDKKINAVIVNDDSNKSDTISNDRDKNVCLPTDLNCPDDRKRIGKDILEGIKPSLDGGNQEIITPTIPKQSIASPLTKTRKQIAAQITKKWRQNKANRIQKRIDAREARVKDTDRNKKAIKRLEDKKFNVENPWWKSKERELDALGSRPENRPYWQSDYQKKMAKLGIKTSGYLDAKYRRRGAMSHAPGAELHGPLSGVSTSSASTSREQNLRNRDFRDYM